MIRTWTALKIQEHKYLVVEAENAEDLAWELYSGMKKKDEWPERFFARHNFIPFTPSWIERIIESAGFGIKKVRVRSDTPGQIHIDIKFYWWAYLRYFTPAHHVLKRILPVSKEWLPLGITAIIHAGKITVMI